MIKGVIKGLQRMKHKQMLFGRAISRHSKRLESLEQLGRLLQKDYSRFYDEWIALKSQVKRIKKAPERLLDYKELLKGLSRLHYRQNMYDTIQAKNRAKFKVFRKQQRGINERQINFTGHAHQRIDEVHKKQVDLELRLIILEGKR